MRQSRVNQRITLIVRFSHEVGNTAAKGSCSVRQPPAMMSGVAARITEIEFQIPWEGSLVPILSGAGRYGVVLGSLLPPRLRSKPA